jgi:hypothetical protein
MLDNFLQRLSVQIIIMKLIRNGFTQTSMVKLLGNESQKVLLLKQFSILIFWLEETL